MLLVCGTSLSLVPHHKLRHAMRALRFVVLRYRSFHSTNFGTQCVLCVLWYFAIARSTAQTSARNACSAFCGTSLSLVPHHKLRHAMRALRFVVLRYRSFHSTNFGTQRVLCVLWYFAIARSTAQTSARNACLFLYPFQHLRKRKLNGYKKLSAHNVCTQRSLWSE